MEGARTRCLYLDLDGTLLGRRGSLMHDGEGAVSIEGPRAVQTCLRAGVEVVLVSGRRRVRVAEDARLLGGDSYIFEGGACVVLDGEEHWLAAGGDRFAPGQDGMSNAEQMERDGGPALLLSRYRGRLEYHEPWSRGREASHLFRGSIDPEEANRLLAEHGHHLRIYDNGVIRRPPGSLAALVQVHAYHLVPAGISKAAAVALHSRARGYAVEETLAVGDSPMDIECAPHVGTFWLVANAVAQNPALADAVREHANAHVTEASHGAGVYEAVVKTLMGASVSGGA